MHVRTKNSAQGIFKCNFIAASAEAAADGKPYPEGNEHVKQQNESNRK